MNDFDILLNGTYSLLNNTLSYMQRNLNKKLVYQKYGALLMVHFEKSAGLVVAKNSSTLDIKRGMDLSSNLSQHLMAL
jgi:hypothetical protein